MLADRWQTLKQILSDALELPVAQRAAFVAKACAGDESMIQEVNSFLAAYEQNESVLERPAVPRNEISPGSRIGVYEIQEMIGAGGMGEVYRAVDTTLGLAVAIKVLPGMMSSDPDRLWRFEHEARAAAILRHPNILYVHQLGVHEGQPYIVSELLEGSTLRARLRAGQLANEEILDYAVQIAEGLKAAHEKGIVHRDLKPENLFVTKFGQVKILDFGLAKAVEGAFPGAGPAIQRGEHRTQTGMMLGTTSYMSPEQLRGEDVGPASDVFSFGVVLYEMVAGELPFQGDTAAVISEAILNRTPTEARKVNPKTPVELEMVIERALRKSAEKRYASAAEMGEELHALQAGMKAGIAGHIRLAFSRAGWKTWLLAGGVIAILVSAPIAWRLRHRPVVPAGKQTIVLADFSNSTGEKIFDDALKQGLEVDLEQSTFLNILADDKVRAQLGYMGRQAEERLTPDLAREVCRREGAQAGLFSSIANLGSHYVLSMKAEDCQNGQLLDEEQGEADKKENVLRQLHELGNRLRGKLGESLASIQKHDRTLEEATTSNLEALQAFSVATRTYRTQGVAASLPLYKRAIELDPNFALAYADLGVMYANLNEDDLATQYATKAYELRDRVTERERFSIDSTYCRSVTGELEKAAQVDAEWKQTYPEDLAPHVNLGVIDSYLGRLEEAAADDQDGLRVQPELAPGYLNLASDYLALGDLDKAEHVLQEAHQRKMDDTTLAARYQLAFLRGDDAEMQKLVAEGAGKSGVEDAMLAGQADTEAFRGRLMLARELTRKAIDSALRADAKETAATWQASAALREAEFGNAAAIQEAVAALAMAKSREVQIAAAMTFARVGEVGRADSIVANLAKRFPQDTLLNRYWLPSIRAAIALRQGRAQAALEELKTTTPYELGGGTPPFSSGATMYPVYLRGEAYLATHQWQAAAGEFEKILDHRGLVWNFPLCVLAQLQLARAQAGGGDQTKARAVYQTLLDSWSGADPNLGALRSARTELKSLH